MIKLFNQCPVCGGAIIVNECSCETCQLQMRGRFQPGQFSGLSEDHITFIKSFLKARGNLSELEKVLGVSYPTIRNKLDEIITLLERLEGGTVSDQEGSNWSANEAENQRKKILGQVASGDISAEEGLARLQQLKGE